MKRRFFCDIFFSRWLRKNRKKQEKVNCEEMPFVLRKREFLSNAAGIIRYLEGMQQKEGRKHLLLYLTSGNWSFVEIKSVVDIAQKRFADISIYIENNDVNKRDIAEFFFEEYGLQVSFLDELDVLMQSKYDTVLCLADAWNEIIKKLICQNAYAVCESEASLKRTRKKIHIDSEGNVMKFCKEEKGDWYSGFVYACDGKQMHYKEALVSLYGEQSIQMQEPNDVEKAISIVAIYGIE